MRKKLNISYSLTIALTLLMVGNNSVMGDRIDRRCPCADFDLIPIKTFINDAKTIKSTQYDGQLVGFEFNGLRWNMERDNYRELFGHDKNRKNKTVKVQDRDVKFDSLKLKEARYVEYPPKNCQCLYTVISKDKNQPTKTVTMKTYLPSHRQRK